MAQRAGRTGLLLEPLDGLALAGDFSVDDHEGHLTPQAGIAGAVRVFHAPGSPGGARIL
jgi:hypothetical protein